MSQNIEMSKNETDLTIWCINGCELRLDINDAEQVEIYEKAIEQLEKNEKFPRVGKSSEIIRHYCKLFRDFFDTIFGNGTAEKIGIVDNARICNVIYGDFLSFVAKQGEYHEQFTNRLASLSTQQGNRIQRRAAAKAKPKTKK